MKAGENKAAIAANSDAIAAVPGKVDMASDSIAAADVAIAAAAAAAAAAGAGSAGGEFGTCDFDQSNWEEHIAWQ